MSPWIDPESQPTLANLRVGQSAAVLAVQPTALTSGRRLLELGMVPGAVVTLLSGGFTLMVQVGDQRLCLRQDLAQAVQVSPLP